MLESILRSHTKDNQLELSIIERQVVGHFQSTVGARSQSRLHIPQFFLLYTTLQYHAKYSSNEKEDMPQYH